MTPPTPHPPPPTPLSCSHPAGAHAAGCLWSLWQTAIHMFTVSTLRAAKMGDIELEGDAGGSERTAEEHIRKRVQIYMVVQKARLLADLNSQGIDMGAANRALSAMVRQREFEEVAQGKKVKRLR